MTVGPVAVVAVAAAVANTAAVWLNLTPGPVGPQHLDGISQLLVVKLRRTVVQYKALLRAIRLYSSLTFSCVRVYL